MLMEANPVMYSVTFLVVAIQSVVVAIQIIQYLVAYLVTFLTLQALKPLQALIFLQALKPLQALIFLQALQIPINHVNKITVRKAHTSIVKEPITIVNPDQTIQNV